MDLIFLIITNNFTSDCEYSLDRLSWSGEFSKILGAGLSQDVEQRIGALSVSPAGRLASLVACECSPCHLDTQERMYGYMRLLQRQLSSGNGTLSIRPEG